MRAHPSRTRFATFTLQQLAAAVTLGCVALALAKFVAWALLSILPIFVCLCISIWKWRGWARAPYGSAIIVSLFVFASSLLQSTLGFVMLFVQSGWFFWLVTRDTHSHLSRLAGMIATCIYGTGVMVLYFLATYTGP